MNRRTVRAGSAAALAWLFAVAAVLAAEREHRVAPGESASSIADRYWAEPALAWVLLAYNGKAGTVIRAGESLRVPLSDEHRVVAGDSWTALARRYLGRAEVWPVVAALNGVPPEQPLQVGQRVVFPVVVEHRLASGETLAVVADRYYADARRGELLARFNGIDDPRRLSVGQRVEVPLITPRPAAPEPSVEPARVVESAPPPDPPPPPAEAFRAELGEVARSLARGEWAGASERIDALRGTVRDRGSVAARAELWRLEAVLHVARDNAVSACRAVEAWAELGGGGEADPDLVSPKVREAFARCLS